MDKSRRKKILCYKIILLTVILTMAFIFIKFGRPIYNSIYYKIFGGQTFSEAISSVDTDVQKRLKPFFDEAGIEYFPEKLSLIAFKKEKKLELWSESQNSKKYIRTYDILAASGTMGPKLKEGDRQVPEGIYNIIGMNQNSYYRFAMLIDYPNRFDIEKANMEKRTNLGGEICIHGSSVSVGCLAVGDEAIEELFLATSKVGMQNVKVIISPYDFRGKKTIDYSISNIKWSRQLYDKIFDELKAYSLE